MLFTNVNIYNNYWGGDSAKYFDTNFMKINQKSKDRSTRGDCAYYANCQNLNDWNLFATSQEMRSDFFFKERLLLLQHFWKFHSCTRGEEEERYHSSNYCTRKVYRVHNGLMAIIRNLKNEKNIWESICTSMVILIISAIVLKINEGFGEGREAHQCRIFLKLGKEIGSIVLNVGGFASGWEVIPNRRHTFHSCDCPGFICCL